MNTLRLYDCDAKILDLLAKGNERQSLEELTIVKFNQSMENANNAKDLLPLCKLRNLERLCLCATYFPLKLDIAEINNEVSHTNLAISGSRELEIIFFSLKASLTHLYLGDYMMDELVIYIAEMCKEIELIEFNSTKLTDAAISHLIRRTEHLKALDVSGCTNFTGLAFADVN